MSSVKKEFFLLRVVKSKIFKLLALVYFVFMVISSIFFATNYYQNIETNLANYSAVKKFLTNKLVNFLSFFDLFRISSLPKETVAMIKMSGVISSNSGTKGINLFNVNKSVNNLRKLYNLKAIVISLNSPGGSPFESEAIADLLRVAANTYKVPIYSFIQESGASGGYWIACAGDKVFATRTSVVGSIGVRGDLFFGFHNVLKKFEIERRIYTAGKNKAAFDLFLPVKEADILTLNAHLQDLHNIFIDYVKDRRGKALDALDKSDDLLFNGDFWLGATALKLGLIDGIDNIDSFMKKNFPSAKLEDITYRHKHSTLDLFPFANQIFDGFFQSLEVFLNQYFMQNRLTSKLD